MKDSPLAVSISWNETIPKTRHKRTYFWNIFTLAIDGNLFMKAIISPFAVLLSFLIYISRKKGKEFDKST